MRTSMDIEFDEYISSMEELKKKGCRGDKCQRDIEIYERVKEVTKQGAYTTYYNENGKSVCRIDLIRVYNLLEMEDMANSRKQ